LVGRAILPAAGIPAGYRSEAPTGRALLAYPALQKLPLFMRRSVCCSLHCLMDSGSVRMMQIAGL